MKRIGFGRLALLAASVVLLTGCVAIDFGPGERYRADFHYSYDLKPGGKVSLENFNGSIDILGWDQNKVEVEGEKYASTEDGLRDVRIDTRDTPELIEIRTLRPSSTGWFPHAGARYTVRVPRSARLERVITTNGRIEARGLDAAVRLKTTNGRIRGEAMRGGVDAQTTNGQIDLRGVEGGAMLRTTNGSITLEMNRQPADTIRAETHNGSITVRVPDETGARLEASTSNARITSEFDIRGHARMERTYMSGDIGKGGSLIELRTTNGPIRLLRN
jgi:hypothetical protein